MNLTDPSGLSIGSFLTGVGKGFLVAAGATIAIAALPEELVILGVAAGAYGIASFVESGFELLVDPCTTADQWHEYAGEAVGGALGGGLGYKGGKWLKGGARGKLNIPTAGRKFNQIERRGWSETTIRETVQSPHATRAATNKATGNSATAYFNRDGSHVVIDDVTGDLVQLSDRTNPRAWVPDPTIQNPYIPPE